MVDLNKVSEILYRVTAIEALKTMKRSMPYSQLSELTNLPSTVLSRYINEHVIPSMDKARLILNLFKRRYLLEVIRERIFTDEVGAVDTTRIIYDPILLKQIIMTEYERVKGFKIDKILTMESDGIPVAYQFASIIGTDVAVARKTKKVGIKHFIEIKQIFDSGAYRYIYLPKDAIKRNEYVLIVDDIIRTGATIRALARICQTVKANVSAVFSVISLGRAKLRLKEELNCPVESFVTL